jgi:polyketide synthase PksN
MPSIFYEHPTLISFANFFLDEYKDLLISHYGSNATTTKVEEVIIDAIPLPIRLTKTRSRKRFKKYISNEQPREILQNMNQPVAIIGISGIMPGSENLDEFWDNIINERDLITEIPKDRWDWRKYYGDPIKESNKTNIKWGGFMKEVDKFDPLFFGISPKEAELMDPQQRLFLETVWNTIEDAGYRAKDISGTKTGIFVGVGTTDYKELLKENDIEIQAQTSTGTAHSVLANRISYLLNLQGPSEPVDTACSSSLVAIHRAVEAIQLGNCDMAIAGGVHVIASPTQYISFSKAGMLSDDGKCKTFDKDANGYVRGEGVGAILMKPFSKAIEDKDHIYSVIKGSHVNHGGHVNSLTTPNPNAQADLIVTAWKKSGIKPTTIGYIEAHGTGTSLGDPIEINGLKKAFNKLYENWELTIPNEAYCGIGSVKTNIGHLETAAGIAGLLKVLLSMKHKKIPANINLKELNPYINLEKSPIYIVDKTIDWKKIGNEPRRAGVSSFGFGGINAHIVLEEYEVKDELILEEEQEHIIILSAKNEERLKEYIKKIVKYIDNVCNKTEESITEIEYMLQLGREPMTERLAVIVKDKEELKRKLSIFLEDDSKVDNLFVGRSANNRQKAKFIEGEEGKEYINLLIKNKKLEKIARLWVSGENIDWKLLHSRKNIRKISLPTYPFAKNRYWIPEKDGVSSIKCNDESFKLHPMIYQNTSTLKEQKFTTKFNGKEFYLVDYVVRGNKALPGVAYLEMANAAGQLSEIPSVVKFKDISFMKLMTKEDLTNEVITNLYPHGSYVEYKVRTCDKNNNSVLHSQGKIYLEHNNESNTQERLFNIEKIEDRCSLSIDNDKLYEDFRKEGLEYGESFRTITKLYCGEKESLAYLELPENLKYNFEEYGLHPSLMEGALQSISGIIPHEGKIFFPYKIGEVEIIRNLNHRCYAYVSLIEETFKEKKFNINLLNEKGQVLVIIRDFIIRVLTDNEDVIEGKNNKEYKIEKLFYTNKLEETSCLNNKTKELEGNILIFSDNLEIINSLKSLVNTEASEIISIKVGENFKKVNNFDYYINPKSYEDYKKLFKCLKDSDIQLAYVIYMWSDNNIFHLSRSLMKQNCKENIKILYTYNTQNNKTKHYCEATKGLFKTIMVENLKISCKILGIEIKEPFELASIVLKELVEGDKEVIYKKGERLINVYKEIKLNKTRETLLKENGVYIITGGAGGVGLIFAKYLAQKYRARLVLTGRSELDINKRKKIESLKQYSTEVIYIKSDISKSEDVKKLLADTKLKYKNINGIIHSAGIIRDSYLTNKTQRDIEEVLAPKVDGTVYLDEFTKNEKLDFFVMFSSISAVLGNVGQSDYAYANSFMDSFAYIRDDMVKQGNRYGKSISINWPLWCEGGMKVDRKTEETLEKNFGFKTLNTDIGIEIFELILMQGEPQIIVLYGNRDKIMNTTTKIQKDKIELEEVLEVEKSSLINKVRKDIVMLVSDLMKLSIDEIDITAEMSEFGFDSITFKQLNNMINEKYNIYLTPSIFYEYSTFEEFIKYLCKNYSNKLINYDSNNIKLISNHTTNGKTISDIEKLDTFRELYDYDCFREVEKMINEPIAIIGMNGIMPQSKNMEEFWINLEEENHLITEIPTDRWDWKDYYGDPINDFNKTNVKWGGFMYEVDKFDPLFFGISPREAELMDPQQRIFLQVVWKLIEDAGYRAKDISGTKTGVFVGVGTSDYKELLEQNGIEIQAQTSTGISHSVLANRVSYLLNLHGPSEPIDTACSSSLVAIH